VNDIAKDIGSTVVDVTEENCDDESDDNETNEREKLRLDNEHEVALSSIQVTSVFFLST
jgi:hypothetical protein